MRLTVVGSGTLIPDAWRGSACHHVSLQGATVLLDCGPGSLRTMARLSLPWQEVSHVVLTHLHTDHVGDLAPLLFALKHGLPVARDEPLTLLGPAGLAAHLEALARAHGPFVMDPGLPLVVQEIQPGSAWLAAGARWRLETVGTIHTPGSLGIRLEGEDGVLGYTGDTGPSPELGPFFRGSHVLVAECSFPDGANVGSHLTPGGLVSLAEVASPKLLVTVHAYPALDPENVPGLLARGGYEGWVLPGRDGLAVDLVSGEVELP